MVKCQQCGLMMEPGESSEHLVRMGYSLSTFPLLSYRRLNLCLDCLEKQKKKDRLEKVLAVIALALVISVLTFGFLMLFGVIE